MPSGTHLSLNMSFSRNILPSFVYIPAIFTIDLRMLLNVRLLKNRTCVVSPRDYLRRSSNDATLPAVTCQLGMLRLLGLRRPSLGHIKKQWHDSRWGAWCRWPRLLISTLPDYRFEVTYNSTHIQNVPTEKCNRNKLLKICYGLASNVTGD